MKVAPVSTLQIAAFGAALVFVGFAAFSAWGQDRPEGEMQLTGGSWYSADLSVQIEFGEGSEFFRYDPEAEKFIKCEALQWPLTAVPSRVECDGTLHTLAVDEPYLLWDGEPLTFTWESLR